MPSAPLFLSLLAAAVLASGCTIPERNANLAAAIIVAPAAETVISGAPARPLPPATSERPEHRTSALATTYTVIEGETLWLIAARKEIYGDALLWPLLYKANRDQIKDPSQIFPGQQLNVPRNLSEAEKEAARETAIKSGLFPVVTPPEVGAPDLR